VKHIVIVGGGFAGLWGAMAAVRQLDDAGRAADVRVSLVSRDRHLTIRPRLHEAHPGEHMRVPLSGVLGPIGVDLVHATATGIDADRRVVLVTDAGGGTRSLSYDRLLLAAGSQLHRPDVPGLAEHGWSADTFEDAMALEAHLQRLAAAPDEPGRLTAVVVGAGFTGIEVAAEMVTRLRELAGGGAGAARVRVVLVERADVVGPDLGDKPRPVIEEALAALGVELRLAATVQSIDRGGMWLGIGERVEARTVIWAAGLRASPVAALASLPMDSLGRLCVDAGLRAEGATDVFAAGDVARAMADSEHPTLMSCQHAMTTGAFAGINVARDLLDLAPTPYAPLPYQTCLDLGAWGALYTRGWDRAPVKVGSEGKAMKRQINTVWIYPPATGDRRDILAAAVPGQHRKAST
jgi:NADH dehydrogenase